MLTIPPEDTYPTVANGGSVTGSKHNRHERGIRFEHVDHSLPVGNRMAPSLKRASRTTRRATTLVPVLRKNSRGDAFKPVIVS